MTLFKNTAKLVLAGALALGGLAVTAPAAPADPPLELAVFIAGVSTGQRADANLVLTASVTYTNMYGSPPAAGNYVYTAIYSCGNLLRTTEGDMGSGNVQSVFFSPDGQPTYSENSVNKRIGPSIEIVSTITQPGFDPYVRQTSYSGYSVSRPSCEQINSGGNPSTSSSPCVVKADAKKLGQARVGQTVKVRAPEVTGDCGRASYTWKASGKVVKQAKALTIKRELRGKTLVAVVKLAKAKPTVLRFGRVR